MMGMIAQLPIEDTTVNSDMPHENFGNYYALFLGRYEGRAVYRSLLKFDMPVIPGENIITKVELVLYIIRNDYPAYPKVCNVYRLIENFDKSIVNYINQPPTDTIPCATLTIDDEVNAFIKIDVTELYNKWYRGEYPNCGLLLKAVDKNMDSLVAFYSKDFGEQLYSPKLEVSFEEPLRFRGISNGLELYSNAKCPVLYFNMGNEYYKDGDFTKALKYYKKAYKNFKSDTEYGPELTMRMIKILDELGMYDEELDMISDGLKYYPDFTDLEFIKASLFRNQGKITLSIKGYKRCLFMGESPLNQSFIAGAGSFRAYHALSEIYFELEDYNEAYNYCIEALKAKPDFTKTLNKMAQILFKKQIGTNSIKSRLENFFGEHLNKTSLIILSDIFFNLKKYDTAFEYLTEAEKVAGYSPDILYLQGLCLLYLRDFQKALECFNEIEAGEFHEKAVYKMSLCEILRGDTENAEKLLDRTEKFKDSNTAIVYRTFIDLMNGKDCKSISEDKEESAGFLDIIFDLLDILLNIISPETFEKSLQLLNLIENDRVLLRLAKLYYDSGFHTLAYQEFIRSMKMFNKIDHESFKILQRITSAAGCGNSITAHIDI